MTISSKEQLEKAALHFGMLPFFSNGISGFSVEEMAAPGMLFGGNDDNGGCWEWKGPIIREQTTAYGKFFNRKAGFISLQLLPDFLNYRRSAYPIAPDGPEQRILDFVRCREGVTSTELKRELFGPSPKKRNPDNLIDLMQHVKPKRHSLEAPLQRLQMGGRLLIADFEYKYTLKGDRYGWGVAVYSTPEIWFERSFEKCSRTPQESFDYLTESIAEKFPTASRHQISIILR